MTMIAPFSTMTLTVAVAPNASLSVTLQLPAATGITVNVALGPLAELGLTVATVESELTALKIPP